MRYKDKLLATFKRYRTQPDSFESQAADRATWRALCRKAVDEFEHSRVQELNEKRRKGKKRVVAPGSFR